MPLVRCVECLDGWRLLLRHPTGTAAGLVTLRDQAVSVSGSLGHSLTVDGQRYSHIIDPRTGQPVRRDLLACVLAPTATQAEALSTALLILGEDTGMALIERLPDTEALLIETATSNTRRPNTQRPNTQRWTSAGWQQATQFLPE